MSEFVPSEAAKAKGVCCTEEESLEAYYKLDVDLRRAAVEFLRSKLGEEQIAKFSELIKKYPGHGEWFHHIYDEDERNMIGEGAVSLSEACNIAKESYYPKIPMSPHFMYGMGVRNELRRNGFGEKEFVCHNLDCVYIYLLEDAVCWNGAIVKTEDK